MAEDTTPDEDEAPKKGGKMGLIIGLVLALLSGGGSFYAVYSGMILGHPSAEEQAAAPVTADLPPISFVPLQPLTISIGPGGTRQLRFRAELEVVPDRTEDVAFLMPRILDILNGYLRAVDLEVLQDSAALTTLRIQMLHRIRLVTGEGHVRDLLITEFVVT